MSDHATSLGASSNAPAQHRARRVPEGAEGLALVERVKDGDVEAKGEMYLKYYRLLKRVAHREISKIPHRSITIEDLIQCGAQGMFHATLKFDPARGVQFHIYAAWFIKRAIQVALYSDGAIRVPEQAQRPANNLRKDPGSDHQRSATRTHRPTVADIWKMRDPLPLDASGGKDGSLLPILGRIPSPDPSPEEECRKKELLTLVHKGMQLLSSQQRAALALRFGLEDGRERTLEEVGLALGLCRERARQIEDVALEKLKKILRERNPKKCF